MDNNKTIYVYDDEGNEIEMEILFTFDADENDVKFRGNKYVLYFNPKEERPQVYASRYIENDDNKGKLESIPEDSIEEWEMIEEVYNTFIEDDGEEE